MMKLQLTKSMDNVKVCPVLEGKREREKKKHCKILFNVEFKETYGYTHILRHLDN